MSSLNEEGQPPAPAPPCAEEGETASSLLEAGEAKTCIRKNSGPPPSTPLEPYETGTSSIFWYDAACENEVHTGHKFIPKTGCRRGTWSLSKHKLVKWETGTVEKYNILNKCTDESRRRDSKCGNIPVSAADLFNCCQYGNFECSRETCKVQAEAAFRTKFPGLPLCGYRGLWELHCMSDCQYGEWGSWGSCSATCGGGTRVRTRAYTAQPHAGGAPCNFEFTRDKETCSATPCPMDCTFGDWQEWGPCSASCGTGARKRVKAFAVSFIDGKGKHGGKDCGTPPSENWKTCSGTDGAQSKPCPVHCVWGTWSEWDACTKTCGGGQRKRSRGYAVHEEHGGVPCRWKAHEVEDCNTHFCYGDCAWHPWGEFEACSRTCGGGTQRRQRFISVMVTAGGKLCTGMPEEWRKCADFPCPVDCAWGEWQTSDHGRGGCSVSCGGGTTAYFRHRITSQQYGGVACDGDSVRMQECGLYVCPEDCLWDCWGPFGPCSKTCGGGFRLRKRSKLRRSMYGGAACIGPAQMTQHCGIEECPPVSALVNTTWPLWKDPNLIETSSNTGMFSPATRLGPSLWTAISAAAAATHLR